MTKSAATSARMIGYRTQWLECGCAKNYWLIVHDLSHTVLSSRYDITAFEKGTAKSNL